MQIFNPSGSVDVIEINGGTDSVAFFTLTKSKEASPNPGTPATKSEETDILYGSMPVAGLSIDQAVDFSISKTLNKDFVISEFGDTPVQITMNGVNIYAGCSNIVEFGKQVLDFYEKNKLSTDPNIRLFLTITGNSTDKGSFTCVLTKMRVIGPAMEKSGSVPVYSYNMTLIGVRR